MNGFLEMHSAGSAYFFSFVGKDESGYNKSQSLHLLGM